MSFSSDGLGDFSRHEPLLPQRQILSMCNDSSPTESIDKNAPPLENVVYNRCTSLYAFLEFELGANYKQKLGIDGGIRLRAEFTSWSPRSKVGPVPQRCRRCC